MRHSRLSISIGKVSAAALCVAALVSAGIFHTPLSLMLPPSLQEAQVRTPPSQRLDSATVWQEAQSPNYVRIVSGAYIDCALKPGDVEFEGLDSLGRTLSVRACVTPEMMKKGSARARTPELPNPSGWGHNKKVAISLPNGRVYHGWFWNRSHMLAKSLGGADIQENLVCGTRMQNVGANDDRGGMGYCEAIARNWLRAHPDGFLYYIVTPLYVGAELLPRSCVVDMLSSDKSINEEVEVYNAAKGFEINFYTGEFCAQK